MKNSRQAQQMTVYLLILVAAVLIFIKAAPYLSHKADDVLDNVTDDFTDEISAYRWVIGHCGPCSAGGPDDESQQKGTQRCRYYCERDDGVEMTDTSLCAMDTGLDYKGKTVNVHCNPSE